MFGEDVVQDAFLRWSATDREVIAHPTAWLTKVLTNLCLNQLASARARRETYVGQWLPEPLLAGDPMLGPAETAEQRESVSYAVLALLERLSPNERAVYVLREAFGCPHREIAEILGITEAALARRASSAYRKLGIESRAECALLLASLAVLAGEARGVPDDPTCSVLRIAWAVQSLCAARGLTPAESSIVPMLIAGVSDAEIATRRGVSKRTVANQTAALYRKLKVGSRFELARAMTRALLAAHEAS